MRLKYLENIVLECHNSLKALETVKINLSHACAAVLLLHSFGGSLASSNIQVVINMPIGTTAYTNDLY